MRVVIDTNVIISGIFWVGKPKQVLNLARTGKISLVTSQCLLQELYGILVSKEKPFRLSREEANLIKDHMKELSEIIQPEAKISVCGDEADNRVLECAVDGRADYVVTGDKDLLDLSSHEGIMILTVAGFLERLKS